MKMKKAVCHHAQVGPCFGNADVYVDNKCRLQGSMAEGRYNGTVFPNKVKSRMRYKHYKIEVFYKIWWEFVYNVQNI